MPWADLVRAVGWWGVAWLGVVAATAGLTVLFARGARRPSLAGLHRDQAGAAYSLSYVITAPVYLLFVCLVFETTLLLVVKTGTVYAAYAGARTAVVWRDAQPADLREPRVRQSAWTALAPFMTLQQSEVSPAGPTPPDAADGAADLAAAYDRYSARSHALRSPVPRAYSRDNPRSAAVRRAYLTAAERAVVKQERDDSKPDGDVTVTVTYRYPFLIPGAGRLLDPDGRYPYEYPVTSRVTLPAEGPVSADGKLGIDYYSR